MNHAQNFVRQLDAVRKHSAEMVEINPVVLDQIGRQQEEITELRQQLDTAWAQAHRLALELECLIMDTKDNAIVSKWWDSAFEAMEEYHKLKPGSAEDAEAWAKMRKAGI